MDLVYRKESAGMQSNWQRWIPLTGILAAVLLFIGFFMATGPENTDNDQKLIQWYADSGHQTTVIIGAYLYAVACVALLLFLNRLRSIVGEAEGKPMFSTFILAAGVVFVAALAVAGACFAAVSADVKFGGDPAFQTPDVIRALNSAAYGSLMVLGMFPLIFAMFTTAYASMRYKIFAAWFNWLTVICGVILFFAVAFIPMIALLVWLIAGSIVLMGRQPELAAMA